MEQILKALLNEIREELDFNEKLVELIGERVDKMKKLSKIIGDWGEKKTTS
jgi:hypothetical protein